MIERTPEQQPAERSVTSERKSPIMPAEVVQATGKVAIAALPLLLNPTSATAALLSVAASESFGLLFTEKRKQRLNTFFSYFNRRLAKLNPEEMEAVDQRIEKEPDEYSALIETTVEQSVSAKSDLRLKVLALLASRSLTQDGAVLFSITILTIIGSLSDIELRVLCLIGQSIFENPQPPFEARTSSIVGTIYHGLDETKQGQPDSYEINDIAEFAFSSLQSRGLIKPAELGLTVDGRTEIWELAPMGFYIQELTGLFTDTETDAEIAVHVE